MAEVDGDLVFTTPSQVKNAANGTDPGDLVNKAQLDAATTRTRNAQTGTAYTLVLGDQTTYTTMDNAAACTVTVPPNSSVPFPVNTSHEVIGIGAGIVTLVAGAGVTINATPSLVFRAQHSGCTLVQITTDVWQAVGDFA